MPLSRKLVENFTEVGELDVILPSIDKIQPPIYNPDCGAQCVEATSYKNRANRICALEAVFALGEKKIEIIEESGPLFLAYVNLSNPDNSEETIKVAIIAQNNDGDSQTRRGSLNAEEHKKALNFLNHADSQGIPVFSITDTPGADAGEKANLEKQSQSISWLISRCSELGVPHINLNLGEGGSGGAIALHGHLSYMTQESWFNTIVPEAAHKIQREGLTLNECINLAGLDPVSLFRNNVKDGVLALRGVREELQNNDFGRKLNLFLWHGIKTIEGAIDEKASQLHGNLKQLSVAQRKELLQILNAFQQEGDKYQYEGVDPAYLEGRKLRDKFNDSLLATLEGNPILMKRYAAYCLMQERLSSVLVYSTVDEFLKKLNIVTGSAEVKKQDANDKKSAFEVLHRWQEFVTNLSVTELSRESVKRLEEYQGKSEEGTSFKQIAARWLQNYFDKGEGAQIANEIVDAIIFKSIQFFGSAASDLLESLATKTKLAKVIEDFSGEDKTKLVHWLKSFSERFEKKLPPWILCNSIVDKCFVEEKGREFVHGAERMQGVEDIKTITKELLKGEHRNFCNWLQEDEKHKIALWHLLQNRFKYSGKHNCLAPLFYYGFRFHAEPGFSLEEALHEVRGYGGPEGVKRFWLTLEDLVRENQMTNVLKEAGKVAPEDIINLSSFVPGSFQEKHKEISCANANNYPGLDAVIQKAIEQNRTPSSIISGEIEIQGEKEQKRIKLILSNPRFQAGAVDMAAGEKIRLTLDDAAENDEDVVMFLNTGGNECERRSTVAYVDACYESSFSDVF